MEFSKKIIKEYKYFNYTAAIFEDLDFSKLYIATDYETLSSFAYYSEVSGEITFYKSIDKKDIEKEKAKYYVVLNDIIKKDETEKEQNYKYAILRHSFGIVNKLFDIN